MKAITLKKAIEKRGGRAKVITKRVVNEFCPNGRTVTNLDGELNGWDIHMIGGEYGESTFFTARRITDRDYYDAGSDYNSGGYSFYHKQKDLDYIK